MRALIIVLVLTVGCGAGPLSPSASNGSPRLPAPPPAPAGWTVVEGPVEYLPATLYEYLDGGAERYQAQGFRQLVHLRYQWGDDELACVTLDLYDMGSELGAFGIYSAARPRDAEPRPWGVEGYRSGTIAAAYGGPVFVHGEADDDRPELLAMLEDLVETTVGAVDGATSPPAMLASLPAGGRVPGSERYVAADLLGHAFLGGGILAEYEIDGLKDELWFSDLGTVDAASRALGLLRGELERRGAAVLGSAETGAGAGFRFADSVAGSGSVVRTGRFVAGAHGGLSTVVRERLLEELVANLEGARD